MTISERLTEPALFKTGAYIGGKWTSGDKSFPVYNPANRQTLADVTDVGAEGAKTAIAAASEGLKRWKKTSPFERCRVLLKWYDLIQRYSDDLGTLITAEMGKPLREAKGEVAYGAAFIEWSAQEAARVHGETLPVAAPGARGWTLRQPVGVVSCITPWNFPAAMITRKAAPALAAGCSIVIKPAPETPLTALALAELADRAGFPAGVFNVICGDAQDLGPVMTGSPEVRMIGFTGSTEVGKLLMRQAADGIKRVSLELGGNAPFIVMDDADLDAAAAGVAQAKFRSGGQTCVSPNRIIVQEGVADAFVGRLQAKIASVKAGDGFDSASDIGPLIHDEAVDRVDALVKSAVAGGAKVLTGGQPLADELGGSFYAPTLLDGGSFDLEIARSEIFGPVASVYRASDETQIVQLANDTPYGLAAYLYTRDIGRVHRMTEELDYGMIGVNAPMVGSASTPFGGVKESGIGREGGKWGVEEFTELKYVLLAGVNG
ncbi:NAD-dependent succinate-semialdehyde dehydrogenase [Hyphobacterium sp.]|uniref:NAD-dependent succinate-semialdehyde dehydrogenase n=1 Tax=Hyphobacterium sp. TaxID=2004662 RepID=UPI003BAC95D2